MAALILADFCLKLDETLNSFLVDGSCSIKSLLFPQAERASLDSGKDPSSRRLGVLTLAQGLGRSCSSRRAGQREHRSQQLLRCPCGLRMEFSPARRRRDWLA